MLEASSEVQGRKHLMKKVFVHGLIELALKACELEIEDKDCVKEAIKILYNLAASDKVKRHLPGETVSVCKRKRKFTSWGGMLILYYLNKTAMLTEVREFFNHSRIEEIMLNNSNAMLEILRKLSKKRSESMEGMNNEREYEASKEVDSVHEEAIKVKGFSKYWYNITVRELLDKLDIHQLIQELTEVVKHKEELLAQKFYEQEIRNEISLQDRKKEKKTIRKKVEERKLKRSIENQRLEERYRKNIKSQQYGKMNESMKNYVCV